MSRDEYGDNFRSAKSNQSKNSGVTIDVTTGGKSVKGKSSSAPEEKRSEGLCKRVVTIVPAD